MLHLELWLMARRLRRRYGHGLNAEERRLIAWVDELHRTESDLPPPNGGPPSEGR